MLSLLRKTLPFVTAVLVVAAGYDAWIFYSRWRAARETERLIQANDNKEARQVTDMLGGGKLKILNFYAKPGTIRSGERANICYSVYGAQSVRIEPTPGKVQPALSRCYEVSPSASTEYKLLAEDTAGGTAVQSVTVEVSR